MDQHIATSKEQGRTLLKFLKKIYYDVPTSRLEKVFRLKDVRVNGIKTNNKKLIIKANDQIMVFGLTIPKPKIFPKARVNFKIIYQDQHILVVSKPINVPVHDGLQALDYQVLTYLDFKCSDSFIPSHIGRLDKATSGLMIYAKTFAALKQLKAKQKNFIKIYDFKSTMQNYNQTIQLFLLHQEKLHKQVVSPSGKLALTKFFTNDFGKQKAQLLTGRKHQIRVTLAFLKKPILGDVKYGGKKADRVYLHCSELRLKNLEAELKYLNHKIFIDPCP